MRVVGNNKLGVRCNIAIDKFIVVGVLDDQIEFEIYGSLRSGGMNVDKVNDIFGDFGTGLSFQYLAIFKQDLCRNAKPDLPRDQTVKDPTVRRPPADDRRQDICVKDDLQRDYALRPIRPYPADSARVHPRPCP